MAKRHHSGKDLFSKLNRCRELIAARSGADEFYETIKILVSKYLFEIDGRKSSLTYEIAQKLLKKNNKSIEKFVEGAIGFIAPEDVINECFELLHDLKLSDLDYQSIDAAFEAMTSNESKADKGQFFTPRYVTDFCIDVLRPQSKEIICDPACGSAGFLHSMYKKIGVHEAKNLYGFDISRRAVQTANFLSFVGCSDSLNIHQTDSLSLNKASLFGSENKDIEILMKRELGKFDGFDIIVTNPPFAGDVSNAECIDQYETSSISTGRVERDVLFIERCITLLKPGGRMGIILPDNKISSNKFSSLREWILKKLSITAVVSLHGYTFQPHTSQKAAIIFATKPLAKSVDRQGVIHMYRSDKPGKSSTGELVMKNQQIDHDLSAIAKDLIKAWKI